MAYAAVKGPVFLADRNCAAAEAGIDFAAFTAPLKRRPDTNHEFFNTNHEFFSKL